MLSHWESGRVHHRAVNACLCPLYAVEGMHVVTVEGEQGRTQANKLFSSLAGLERERREIAYFTSTLSITGELNSRFC